MACVAQQGAALQPDVNGDGVCMQQCAPSNHSMRISPRPKHCALVPPGTGWENVRRVA